MLRKGSVYAKLHTMKIDSIILDVDGTIWNTTDIVAQAWNLAIDKLYPQVAHVTGQILKGQFGKTMNVIADNLFSPLDEDGKSILIKECCVQEQIALDSNTKDITYSGVLKTIEELSKHIPLFIVSNCQSGYIELVIRKNKLEKYITDFECFGNTGKGKDENIHLLCERNNLKSPVYVGDTQGDYDACKKAGVPFVWAAYGFGKPDDDGYFAKIDEFSQLADLING